VAKGAVMIDFGETQVFEGEMAHAGKSRVDVDRAVTDIIEEFSELVFCHGLGYR
jgi:hypothetical protein